MPKSIILFERLAWLTVAFHIIGAIMDFTDTNSLQQHGGLLIAYDLAMIALRIAIIWLIVHRLSNLLRWGWVVFVFVNAAINAAYLATQLGDVDTMRWLVTVAYFGLMLASAVALLVPASAEWFRASGRELHA